MTDGDLLTLDPAARSLEANKGVVLGVANRQSIASGCAAVFRLLGAELALT